MKLKLKQSTVENPINPPLDRYGVPCPNAFVTETGYSRDPRNKIIIVQWAIYRTEQECIDNKEPIKQGFYKWEREAKESVYDSNDPTKLLIPRFGAYDSVTNIIDSVNGTEFGEQGATWIGLHSEWKDYEIVS